MSEKVDSRGKRIIELLNMSDMVVLNGVQGTRAQYTCKGVRGDGIDDYVAVSRALVERTSQLEYGCEKELDTDHVALSCKLTVNKTLSGVSSKWSPERFFVSQRDPSVRPFLFFWKKV